MLQGSKCIQDSAAQGIGSHLSDPFIVLVFIPSPPCSPLPQSPIRPHTDTHLDDGDLLAEQPLVHG